MSVAAIARRGSTQRSITMPRNIRWCVRWSAAKTGAGATPTRRFLSRSSRPEVRAGLFFTSLLAYPAAKTFRKTRSHAARTLLSRWYARLHGSRRESTRLLWARRRDAGSALYCREEPVGRPGNESLEWAAG